MNKVGTDSGDTIKSTSEAVDVNYEVCNILASVPASRRQYRLDYLREHGIEKFLEYFKLVR